MEHRNRKRRFIQNESSPDPLFEDKLIGGKVYIHDRSVSLPVIGDNESYYEIDPETQQITYIVK